MTGQQRLNKLRRLQDALPPQLNARSKLCDLIHIQDTWLNPFDAKDMLWLMNRAPDKLEGKCTHQEELDLVFRHTRRLRDGREADDATALELTKQGLYQGH